MTARLAHQSYGKHRVRVSKIKRSADGATHDFVEASVDVELQGGFDAAYTQADNRSIVATDSIRNTVYALAKDDAWDCHECLALRIARHFLSRYGHVTRATVRLRGHGWRRIDGHPHCFTGSDAETPTVSVVAERGGAIRLTAGLDGLMIAKTTQSGFENFVRDEFRTLPDTADRILASVLTATWDYDQDFTATPGGDHAEAFGFLGHRAAVRAALLHAFTDHYSVSVQQTLYRMGEAALSACGRIEKITLTMPNKHHLRFNLEPLGRSNDNEVFLATDEPFGFIHAEVARA